MVEDLVLPPCWSPTLATVLGRRQGQGKFDPEVASPDDFDDFSRADSG